MKHVLYLAFIVLAQISKSQDLAQYKSLLVYKISEYVMWPGNPEVINVKTFGQSDVNKYLSKFAQKKEHLNVSEMNQASDMKDCHLIFLPESHSGKFSNIRALTRELGVLVVSEDKSMISKGADIVVFVENDKLKYIINEGSISAKGMIASKKLAVLGASI